MCLECDVDLVDYLESGCFCSPAAGTFQGHTRLTSARHLSGGGSSKLVQDLKPRLCSYQYRPNLCMSTCSTMVVYVLYLITIWKRGFFSWSDSLLFDKPCCWHGNVKYATTCWLCNGTSLHAGHIESTLYSASMWLSPALPCTYLSFSPWFSQACTEGTYMSCTHMSMTIHCD